MVDASITKHTRWVVDDGKAGRNQGGDFLPLNRPEEKDAISSAGSLIVSLTKI